MDHSCHAFGCTHRIPPKYLFCYAHWAMLPKSFQRLVYSAYRAGQEVDKQPSARYMAIQNMCIAIVARLEDRVEIADGSSKRAHEWADKAGNHAEIAEAMNAGRDEFIQAYEQRRAV